LDEIERKNQVIFSAGEVIQILGALQTIDQNAADLPVNL
jgi:hypothetical protein